MNPRSRGRGTSVGTLGPEDVVFYDASAYSGFWRRMLVLAVDFLLLLAVGIPFFLLADYLSSAGFESGLLLIITLPFWIFAFFYLTLVKASRFGTLGYRLAKVKIVNFSGHSPSLWYMSFRLALWVFGPINSILDLGFIPSSHRKQSIRDKVVGTFVVQRDAEPCGVGKKRMVRWHFMSMAFIFPEIVETDQGLAENHDADGRNSA
jgi:uncharacterized RDD family membrane protein YckC